MQTSLETFLLPYGSFGAREQGLLCLCVVCLPFYSLMGVSVNLSSNRNDRKFKIAKPFYSLMGVSKEVQIVFAYV